MTLRCNWHLCWYVLKVSDGYSDTFDDYDDYDMVSSVWTTSDSEFVDEYEFNISRTDKVVDDLSEFDMLETAQISADIEVLLRLVKWEQRSLALRK